MAAPAFADENIALKVGQSVEYAPGFLPAQVVCDDLAVVLVEDIGPRFRLTGRRAGATDCGFWSVAPRGQRRAVHITVSGAR